MMILKVNVEVMNLGICWINNGTLHRIDGPAIVYTGHLAKIPPRYFINSAEFTDEEFKSRLYGIKKKTCVR